MALFTTGVFLSYSHADSVSAGKLRLELERQGISVRIDSEAMAPGQQIRQFILDSIRSTRATVWVVSESSLSSQWVAVEIITSLGEAELWQQRQLIACFLDANFLDDAFRLRKTDEIDERLAQITALLAEHAARQLDSDDLDAERSRLYKLRSGLGKLLGHLRGTLCLDIRDEQFTNNLDRLVATLRPLAPRAPDTPLVAASDFVERKDEIRRLFFTGERDRALLRLLDFVRDFSKNAKYLDEVIVVSALYHELEGAQGAVKERKELLLQALALIDTVIQELSARAA